MVCVSPFHIRLPLRSEGKEMHLATNLNTQTFTNLFFINLKFIIIGLIKISSAYNSSVYVNYIQ